MPGLTLAERVVAALQRGPLTYPELTNALMLRRNEESGLLAAIRSLEGTRAIEVRFMYRVARPEGEGE